MTGECDQISAPPLRLDLRQERLWNAEQLVDLRPKTWALIRYMVERPHELLSKQQLIDTIWPDTIVTEASLNQAIRELRKALGDDARSPKFIETVHRRGFRYIGVPAESAQVDSQSPAQEPTSRPKLFGRQAELVQLNECFHQANAGNRQILFVTGEAGIGKTSLVRTFLDEQSRNRGDDHVSIGLGQCINHHSEGEPYLPVLEAIDRLARGLHGEMVQQTLKHYAPTWFAQFPWMLDSRHDYEQQLTTVTATQMLREFCVFIESLTARIPVILWIEDLHWGDNSSINLLDALARREENARLFVIVSYRPVDAVLEGSLISQLKQTLSLHGFAAELALELLDYTAIGAYLGSRFHNIESTAAVTELVEDQTGGNPLFVITLADYLVEHGLLEQGEGQMRFTVPVEKVCDECPKSLRAIVKLQISVTTEQELSLLDAASIIGTKFSAQGIAGALAQEPKKAEEVCGQLAKRGQFLILDGTTNWPDGSIGQGYEFIHDIYRQTLYDAMPPGVRQGLHRNYANRLSTGFDGQRKSVVTELALHFELGGVRDQAITFLILAAEKAQFRSSGREAVAYLDRALAQLAALPQDKETERRELKVHLLLLHSLLFSVGYTSDQLDPHITRALELCNRLDDKSGQLRVLAYQGACYMLRGHHLGVEQTIEAAKSIEPFVSDPVLLSHRSLVSGVLAQVSGRHETALKHFTQCVDMLDDTDMRAPSRAFGHDPAVLAIGFSSLSAWMLGFPDEARTRVVSCMRRSEAVGGALSLVHGFDFALSLEQFRRDVVAAQSFDDSLMACMEKYGVAFTYMRKIASQNWLLLQTGAAEDAVTGLTKGIASAREQGARLFSSVSLTTLAEAHLANGAITEGLAIADEALDIVQDGERFWEAETYRIKGELLRLENKDSAAEECFRASLKVAASQSVLSLELRAAKSLAKLLVKNGRKPEARQIVENTLCRFTEGFESADLQEATSLLNTL
jgi:DNA-binding winged helix-turn-helix (wHTH) protein/tetratricopeptide (TPR) repeat protein